ncbi:MAG: thioredoxin [Comamonadaceae bacterium CG_4_9_14_0_8_um_filter_60_18]|nr:MAG: thioredoxin [Comamonadaceae bacterium CG_4_9_14_0_8_um_filter_60_18]
MTITPANAPILVVCLCAQWCGVCRDYRSRFEQARAQVHSSCPQAQFLWIDIEDEADLLHPLDVEDFPTLLLARGSEARFFGPLTPQVETLVRMVQTQAINPQAAPLPAPELTALVARVRSAHPE